jgi:hypothetical protein
MPKYFVCPMSKNIVDAICEMDSNTFGFTVTRRQVDYDGGYVNKWNTKSFHDYVKSKNSNIVLERDHGGPAQGTIEDDGHTSYIEDLNYFDLIHLDPWKHYQDLSEGLTSTTSNILEFYKSNPRVKYEILTEGAIRQFSTEDYNIVLSKLKAELSIEAFNNIEYVVVQSGVGIDLVSRKNADQFLDQPLLEAIDICKAYGKKVKEHNGDYLSSAAREWRFNKGVDAINIGPELAQLETEIYLQHMTESEKNSFYEVCVSSKKWQRWVTPNFDLNNREMVIQVCGHYNYDKLPLDRDLDNIIKDTIKHKLNEY